MDRVALTLTEAATLLPIEEPALRQIVAALHIRPASHRHNGHRGHPKAEYDWTELVRLHNALRPWLAPEPDLVDQYADPGLIVRVRHGGTIP